MSYCPKCGNKVEETMTFCPRCGASLKVQAAGPSPPPPTYRREEKAEKGEKQEKKEPEKGEKGEFGFVGWLIGGLIIIIIGIAAYLRAVGYLSQPVEGAVVILVIGVAILIVAIWLSMRAKKRYPAPPAT